MNTKSEDLFEAFLTANSVAFSRIEEAQNQKGARRPDYLVEGDGLKIIFEIKQLDEDPAAERAQVTGVWSSTPGGMLRQLIKRSKKQIQFGAAQGMPSILLVYNNADPWQDRHTASLDFETAMYGQLTTLIQKPTNRSSEFFHGDNSELQEGKNTSFSAVGHLRDRGGTTTIKLWENPYAKIPLPFDRLPSYFAVQRVAIDNSPLRFA
jgi:hypothetical protein